MLTDLSLGPRALTLRRTFAAGMLLLVLTAPLASQSLPRAKPDDVGRYADCLQRLTAAFGDYVKSGRLPGAVILVQDVGARGRLARSSNSDGAAPTIPRTGSTLPRALWWST